MNVRHVILTQTANQSLIWSHMLACFSSAGFIAQASHGGHKRNKSCEYRAVYNEPDLQGTEPCLHSAQWSPGDEVMWCVASAGRSVWCCGRCWPVRSRIKTWTRLLSYGALGTTACSFLFLKAALMASKSCSDSAGERRRKKVQL